MILDHLVVCGTDRDAACAHVEDALGVSMQPGGEHAVFHTHNTLLGLEDGIYLEAISANPAAPAPQRPRWFDLDRFQGPPRLSNWVCAVPNMDTALAQLPDGTGSPVELQRGDLRWRMAVSPEGTTPFDCLFPAIIQWSGGVHPAKTLTQVGVRLRRLTLAHPDGGALAQALGEHLNDDRIAVEKGPIAMNAVFETPAGERHL